MAAAATNGLAPKITLYTNHGCPWAHRAHIALKELQLPYEEVIIDLGRPREEWYLEINPVGNLFPISLQQATEGQASLTKLREVSFHRSNTRTRALTPSSRSPASSPNSSPIPIPLTSFLRPMPRLPLLCSELRSISSSTPISPRSIRSCTRS